MSLRATLPTVLAAACLLGAAAQAQPAPSISTDHYEWITLGTQGGPMPSLKRGEPANMLLKQGSAILVDTGDGAITRAIGAGARFDWIHAIFISHLHVDHTGGLFAVIGLRNQTHTTTPLVIYGPPGTKETVAGILAGLKPYSESGYGIPGEKELPADTGITVAEINDGSTVSLPGVKVRAAKNTHYSFVPGSSLDRHFASLSYRFDMPDRSIVYTGDTGPSEKVEALAKGADLLVSEMIDEQATMENVKSRGQNMDPKTLAVMTKHLTSHHLTSADVAHLASVAGVKSVVVTHLAGGGAPGAEQRYASEISAGFQGKVTIAHDMERF